MNKKILYGRLFLSAVLFCMCLVFLLYIYTGLNGVEDSNAVSAEDDWSISVDGVLYDNVNLLEFKLPDVTGGSVVTINGYLPELNDKDMAMQFKTTLSVVDVYMDDELIYSYGHEYYSSGRLVGSGTHIIALPDDYFSKRMTIVLVVTENGAFTSIPEIKLEPIESMYLNYANERKLNIVVSMSIAGLGCIVTLISLFAVCFSGDYKRLLLIGLFSFFMGSWSLCYDGTIQIVSHNYYLMTLLEYFSLYNAPVPLMYLLCDVRSDARGIRRFTIHFSTVLVTAFAVISFILQMTDLVHYSLMLPYFHVIVAFCLTITLVSVLTGIIRLERSNLILFCGIIVLCITSALDLLRYNLLKYVLQDERWLHISILPFGTLGMIVLMIVSYVFYLFGIIQDKTRQEILIQQAYFDALTGIYNRNKCREIFKELCTAKENYSIISYDLNGLKYTNDNFGHSQGDILIKTFARLLTDVFGDIGSVIRMGGDEFIVIFRGVSDSKICRAIKKYEQFMAESENRYGIRLDSSYGLAGSSEIEEGQLNPEKVYVLADERMYEMKRKIHKGGSDSE